MVLHAAYIKTAIVSFRGRHDNPKTALPRANKPTRRPATSQPLSQPHNPLHTGTPPAANPALPHLNLPQSARLPPLHFHPKALQFHLPFEIKKEVGPFGGGGGGWGVDCGRGVGRGGGRAVEGGGRGRGCGGCGGVCLQEVVEVTFYVVCYGFIMDFMYLMMRHMCWMVSLVPISKFLTIFLNS
jgi:hypothetical protein